ncbi:alpha/beta hydrolase [Winogradskyella sp.]|uniref:alpha/beta fold hydrolase n=1 Tax=Winogradskyella sp. TaxID=1883156 RepID=UPI0026052FC1|nr:alpha/beta hydrolase [Winogradskyella sp.]
MKKAQKRLRKKLTWIIVMIFFMVFILVTNSCFTYTDAIKNDASIVEMGDVNIGGIEQWVLIRGEDRENPVIVFLHGGPGSPETAFLRKYNSELEKHFTMVYWDQRGAGKSYDKKIPQETMNLDQFLSDTHELIVYVKKKLNKEKVHLMGHSWGSVLGLLTSAQHPELVDTYIGIGQVVNTERGEKLSFDYTMREAKKDNNQKAIDQLNSVGPPVKGEYENNGIWTQRKWLLHYGGERYGKTGVMDAIFDLWFSDEYNFFDVIKFTKSSGFAYRLRRDEKKIDFFKQVQYVEVPVYFISGKYDYNTPKELVKEYSEILQAPKVGYYEFEQSSHSPIFEEPEKFNELIIKLLTHPNNNSKL